MSGYPGQDAALYAANLRRARLVFVLAARAVDAADLRLLMGALGLERADAARARRMRAAGRL